MHAGRLRVVDAGGPRARSRLSRVAQRHRLSAGHRPQRPYIIVVVPVVAGSPTRSPRRRPPAAAAPVPRARQDRGRCHRRRRGRGRRRLDRARPASGSVPFEGPRLARAQGTVYLMEVHNGANWRIR